MILSVYLKPTSPSYDLGYWAHLILVRISSISIDDACVALIETSSLTIIDDCLSTGLNQVKDVDRVQTLGTLTIPLSRVLSTSGLSLDQWFQLDNSGSASRIYINAALRVNERLVNLDRGYASEKSM